MNLPNKLTLSRFLLTILFVFFIIQKGPIFKIIATIIFLIASLTDFYDGYLAKKHNLVSDFGKIMDPLADKFLILVAFFVFVRMKIIPSWMFVLIFTREFVVTGLRIFAIGQGKVIAAEKLGKYKTVSQIIAISAILIFCIMKDFHVMQEGPLYFYLVTIVSILIYITIVLAVSSGISYLWHNRSLLYVTKIH